MGAASADRPTAVDRRDYRGPGHAVPVHQVFLQLRGQCGAVIGVGDGEYRSYRTVTGAPRRSATLNLVTMTVASPRGCCRPVQVYDDRLAAPAVRAG